MSRCNQAMRRNLAQIECVLSQDCSVVLVKDVIYSGPLFWEQRFTVLATTNAAFAPILSVCLHIKSLTVTADIYLESVGLELASVMVQLSDEWLQWVSLPSQSGHFYPFLILIPKSVDCCVTGPNGRWNSKLEVHCCASLFMNKISVSSESSADINEQAVISSLSVPLFAQISIPVSVLFSVPCFSSCSNKCSNMSNAYTRL